MKYGGIDVTYSYNGKGLLDTVKKTIYGLAIIFDIIWCVWTWKWMKPTKYEIGNAYLND